VQDIQGESIRHVAREKKHTRMCAYVPPFVMLEDRSHAEISFGLAKRILDLREHVAGFPHHENVQQRL